jgi:hypothetical protein
MMFANKQVSNNSNNNSNTNSMMLKQRQAQLSPQTPMIMMMPQHQQQLMAQPQQQMIALAPPQQQAAPLEQQEQAIPQQQQAAMMMMTSQPELSPPQAQLQESPMQTALETPTLTATKHAKTNKHGHRPAVNHRPLPRNPQPPQQQHQQQQQQQPPQQQILYYDPEQAMVNGQLEVPMTVYDQQGNPIPLQQLRGARILMEPPQARIQANPRQMSAQDVQKWGESTSQDQSIIVATVAVMALLVGALSARRMRARNVLSACIENEALEDDVAYDTAYTTSQKDNSYYNTFASGGWKGDLEKFDV